jgi:hypothetical protein
LATRFSRKSPKKTQAFLRRADPVYIHGNAAIMIIERVPLDSIRLHPHISTLSSLEIGESIFCSELKQAQSLRALSYYMIRSRNMDRKFTFRKMDRGWRIIRVR